MRKFATLCSRLTFLVASGFLFVGIHRYIFGEFPKLIWDRDLPWGQVRYEWCFAIALGLSVIGAVLGRTGKPTATTAAELPIA
jgi:hypothetical protein